MRWLTAIPVYNEAKYLPDVLNEVRRFSPELLVINDGSSDGTAELLAGETDVQVVTHPRNRGYGAALVSAFEYALRHGYDQLVTMDCDGQHEPSRIPVLLEALHGDVEIVSGSRYLRDFRQNTYVPEERKTINRQVTAELNRRYGWELTDAFCGFKAYRVPALAKFHITEFGYGMPLQLWAQAAKLGYRVREVGVPLIYLDASRAFGGALDDAASRLAHYYDVLDTAERAFDGCYGAALVPGTCGS